MASATSEKEKAMATDVIASAGDEDREKSRAAVEQPSADGTRPGATKNPEPRNRPASSIMHTTHWRNSAISGFGSSSRGGDIT